MSTRLLVTECFDGNHTECKGYNGPADNPNFRCDCDCHKTQPQQQDAPERIWIDGAGVDAAKRTGVGSFYTEKNDTAGGRDIEYIRATADADDDLIDETQRRMDQVVEAAVEWHQRVLEIVVSVIVIAIALALVWMALGR